MKETLEPVSYIYLLLTGIDVERCDNQCMRDGANGGAGDGSDGLRG